MPGSDEMLTSVRASDKTVSQFDSDMSLNIDQEPPLILVVEDDFSQSLILSSILKKKGYRVIEASNGKQAVETYEKYRPLMVLVDAVMPEMDGFEACKRIRALDKENKTLVMMITALDDDDSVEKAFKVGAEDYITKPINWSLLTARVKYLIQAKVADQHIRLVNERLRQSHKMEAMGNMTKGIAHNFNNILASIMGYTELLIGRSELGKDEKSSHYLQQVLKSSKRARDIILQMQAFSAKSGGIPQILKVQSLFDETLKMLRSTLPSSVEIHQQIEDDLPRIKVDPLQFQQLITDLAINACDAMDNSGRIDMSLKLVNVHNMHCASCHEMVNGTFVELMVKDSGSGIDNEILDKMFDPYFTTKPLVHGGGMGLSVVHGTVHESGGHILVETAKAKGTVFKLLFPLSDIEDEQDESADTADDGLARATGDFHILVVDDESAVARYEIELFTMGGYQATMVVDPREALQLITENPEAYDLLLTDQIMPGLSGIELVEAVRKVNPNLPVILCTGNQDFVPDIDLESIGIQVILNKPMQAARLLHTVRDVLLKNKPDDTD